MAAMSSSAVFVDTSLGTHLAMLVSDSDTVSDFKEKLLVEHQLCFPNLGVISVNAVKVKCKGHLYHLVDSMLIKSAFNGTKKNWFLSVDISGSPQHFERQEMLIHCSVDQPVIAVKPPDDQFNIASHDQPHKAVMNFEVLSAAKASSNLDDIEMHDADSDKQHSKENEGAGVNTSPAVLREPGNLKSGTEHSKAENTKFVGYQSSEADVSNKNVMAYSDGPMLMLTNTSTEFGADKKDGNIESSSLTSELLAASKAMELQSSSKRRKKMKRAKSPDGENPIAFGTKNIEGTHRSNLTASQKAEGGDKSLDGHESGGNNLSQTARIEAGMQAAEREPLDVHVIGMESSQQITEKEVNIESITDKTINNRRKRKKSTGKSLPSVEMKDPDTGSNDLLPLSATMDETDCKESSHVKPMEALSHQTGGNDEGNLPKLIPHGGDPADKADNTDTEDKTIKERRKRKKSIEKSLPSVELKDPNSSSNDLLPMNATVDETDCEHSSHVKAGEAPSLQSGGNDESNLPQLVINLSPPDGEHADKADNLSPLGTEDTTIKKRMKRKKPTVKSLSGVEMKYLNSDSNDLITMSTTVDETDCERRSHVKSVEAPPNQSRRNDEGNLPKLVTNLSSPGGEHANKVDNLSPLGTEDTTIKKRMKRKKSTRKSPASVEIKEPNSCSNNLLIMNATVDETDCEHSSHVKPVEGPSHQTEGNGEGNLLVTCPSVPGGEHADKADNLSPLGTEDTTIKKRMKRKKSTRKSLAGVEIKDPNSSSYDLLTMDTAMDGTDCKHSSHVKSVEDPSHQIGGNDEDNLPKLVTNLSPPSGEYADKADHLSPPGTKDTTIKKRMKRKKSTGKSLPSVEIKYPNSSSNDLLTMNAIVVETDCKHSSHMKPVEAPSHQSGGTDEGNLSKLVTNLSSPGGEHADKVDNLSPPRTEDTTIKKRMKNKKTIGKSLPNMEIKDPNSGSNDLLTMSATMDEIDCEHNSHVKPVEVHGSNEINFSDFFAPTQHEHEIRAPENSLVGEGTKGNRADRMVNGKKKKKSDVSVGGPSSASQGPEDGSLAGNSTSIQHQRSESNDRQDYLKAGDDKSPPVIPSKDLASLSFKSDKLNVISQEVSRAQSTGVSANSEKNSEASGASRSGLKGTKIVRTGKKEQSGLNRYLVAARKSSDHHTGEFVDTSGHKKSLLPTSVAIFNDESSGSSREDGEMEKSNSSTRMQSDSVLSSDYSDGDSHSNWNSPMDDYPSKNVGGRITMKKTYSSHEKNLTLHKIMRSSSRFKKAKLVASQSLLDDTESQPDEFVPDSQANL